MAIPARPAVTEWWDEDQGNEGLLVVKGGPVAEVAVLAEMLAVVGRDHDPGVRQETRVAEAPEESAQLGVQTGDALVVEVSQAAADGVQLPLALGSVLRVGGISRLQ